MLSNQIATSNIKMKTYQQLWQSLTPLYDAGEAQAIVRTVLDVKYGMTLTDIICGKVNEISADEERKLEEIIIRLQKGEPVQYVLGEADFAGRPFHVEPGVLIPRPETAELCQWIEKDMIEKSIVSSGDSPEDSSGNSPQATDDARLILDICTGSGCIAITLGLNIPNSEVTGWDISEERTYQPALYTHKITIGMVFDRIDMQGNEEFIEGTHPEMQVFWQKFRQLKAEHNTLNAIKVREI